VAIGAALAPTFVLWRLGAALGAFLLALGVGCHALDELAGRPLDSDKESQPATGRETNRPARTALIQHSLSLSDKE
jgi:hypothetical protein